MKKESLKTKSGKIKKETVRDINGEGEREKEEGGEGRGGEERGQSKKNNNNKKKSQNKVSHSSMGVCFYLGWPVWRNVNEC